MRTPLNEVWSGAVNGRWWPAGCAVAVLAGCGAPEGLRLTPPGDGPRIVHQMDTRPFPDIPFPNDLGTRPDATSPTGRRLNVGVRSDSRLETRVRAQLDTLDGFASYGPITVSFDAPIDLDALDRRQRDNLDWSDDAVYLIDIQPDSPGFGQPVLLDMDRGNFPHLLQPDTHYHPSDPRQDSPALVFETADEDSDGDGRLDPGEDSDGDGRLDVPNVHPPGSPVVDGLRTAWELASNTLILRPVVPLRERTRYAVVLTDRLVDVAGRPVRSPFAWVHHLAHTAALRQLPAVFARWRDDGVDMALERVAYAWSFTTQSVTADLVAIREGLYGIGPLGWLAETAPADAVPALARDPAASEQPYVFERQLLQDLARTVLIPAFEISQVQGQALLEDMEHVAHVVQGHFTTPDLLSDPDSDFIWDWTFDLDARRGRARVQPSRIPFTLVVPRATAHHAQPFPVAVYAHGFGQARVEFLAFANVLAKYGIASAGIDAWGHGVKIGEFERSLIRSLAESRGYLPFTETFLEGRARDLDGDGAIDAGGDTFSTYAFHTRDVVRQSIVDLLQLVRVLRGFDGRRSWALDQDGDGRDDAAGDFDGDGTVDAGGPDRPYFCWGSSMGGIFATILGALEPAIVASAPVAGGGGLTYLTSRSKQESVRYDTVLRALGPVIVAEPAAAGQGRMDLSYVAGLTRELRRLPIAAGIDARPGDLLEVTNLDRDAVHRARIQPGPRCAVHMQADAGDRFAVRLLDADCRLLAAFDQWQQDVWYHARAAPDFSAGQPLRSPAAGWGMHRGSPDLRRLIGLAQTALEPADPINYARHHFAEPLPIRPEGATPSDLLLIVTLGDPNNPVDIHAAVARAAGILPYLDADPRYGMSPNDWLIENHVYEGICGLGRHPPNAAGQEVLFDPDALADLAAGNGFDAPRPEPGRELRLDVPTASGRSGIRFAHMRPCGSHSFFITDPSKRFNADEYLNSLAGHYFASHGDRILDDACHHDSSCSLP